MYAPLVLLWISFVSVHGEMIQCFVGGIIDYDPNNEPIMRQEYCNSMEKASQDKDDDDYDTPFRIVEYWDNIVDRGTDMHRLKFHSKLLTMYKKNYEFSNEESMVFLKSSYSAVSIYYFTNNILIARCVAQDGVNFLEKVKNELYNNYENTVEIQMWEILTNLIEYEMNNNSNSSFDTNFWTNNYVVKNLMNQMLSRISYGHQFPFSYLFMFRSMLLEKYQLQLLGNEPWNKLISLINDGSIDMFENHSDNKKLRMHMNLILSAYSPEEEEIIGLTSFNHLMNALKITVFTSEDRLLNYKATVMAMNSISKCVDENGWITYTDDNFCNSINSYREIQPDIDYILTKLTHMQIYKIANDDFIPNCIQDNEIIDEYSMHMIVTMAIDNIDNDSSLSLKRIKIVKEIISRINYYRRQQNKLKRNKNVMTAYKWLAELHGVLSTNLPNAKQTVNHIQKTEIALSRAESIQKAYKIIDDHLEFLIYKRICKDEFPPYFSERSYNADGWINKIPSSFQTLFKKSKIYKAQKCDRISKFLSINNPFVHQADVNILMARKWMMVEENNTAAHYLENALSHWVITAEDRVRNLQAHELYSFYVLWKN